MPIESTLERIRHGIRTVLKLYHRDGSLLEVYSIEQIKEMSRHAAA